jgi:hypothetical protein
MNDGDYNLAEQSELTTRSIRFGACVGVGLLMSHLQGISPLEIAQTALVASSLFLAFLLGEAAMARYGRKMRRRRR